MSVLADARHKFERALFHSNEFTNEVKTWIEQRNNTSPDGQFIKRYEREQSRFVYSIGDVFIASPPKWSLMVGDAVHNFRSTLDYIAWTLVDIGGESKPLKQPTKIQFPIAESLEKMKGWPKQIATRLPGVDQRFIEVINLCQPYDRKTGHFEDRHPLAILNFLNNRDKHRELQVIAEYPMSMTFQPTEELNCHVVSIEVNPNLTEPVRGMDILFVNIVPTSAGEPDVKVAHGTEITLAVEPTIFPPPTIPPDVMLTDIGLAVGSVLTAFEALVES